MYLVCRGQALIARKHARGLAKGLTPLRLALGGLAARATGIVRPGQRALMEAKLAGLRAGWRREPVDKNRLT